MTETLSAAAASLVRAAEVLVGAGSRLPGCDPGVSAFGGAGPGRLGDLGRVLHQGWLRAVTAREGEAAGHATRMDEAAAAVARAATGYRHIDEARRRGPEMS